MAHPSRGPLAATAVRWSALAGDRPRLLHADLDLADRAATRRALGTSPGDDVTDEALVLAAYDRWGPAAPEHLGGQFAFAVWDPGRGAVVAARDPLGLRPLFWGRAADTLVVGGDIRAVLEAGGLPDALDPDRMAGVLLDPHLLDPGSLGRTCLRAVDELPAGHRLIWRDGTARTERYWRPEGLSVQPFRTIHEVGEAMRAALREAVADAVADAAPGELGSHLTPGIDAATVLAFAADALADAGRQPPHAFTWTPPPDPRAPLAPEHRQMQALVDRWGGPLTYAPIAPETILRGTLLDATRDPTTMWTAEEPVRRAAHAAGVRVLLSGWGGDEAASFSGRSRVTAHLVRTGRWGPVAARVVRDPLDTARRAKAWWASRSAPASAPRPERLRAEALEGDRACFAWPDLLRHAHLPAPDEAPDAPRPMVHWLLTNGHIGRRASAWARAGAPYGLRYRYPLLDRRVLAVALGVPEALWMTRRRLRRWPFRAAGAGLVPDRIRLGNKADAPHGAHWHRASASLYGHLAPFVTEAAAGDRAAFVDVARLRAALDATARDIADGRPPTSREDIQGLHAAGYLGLGDAHGLDLTEPLAL